MGFDQSRRYFHYHNLQEVQEIDDPPTEAIVDDSGEERNCSEMKKSSATNTMFTLGLAVYSVKKIIKKYENLIRKSIARKKL